MEHINYAAKTKYHILKNRRILSYCEFGDHGGVPVFYSHAIPGSRLEGALFHTQAIKQQFRIICIDRPGMGESTYLPDRKLLDYPNDIIELADELKIDKFGLISWSGGGAYGLACGRLIPERMLFNLVLAGYTSFMEMSEAINYINSRLGQISVGLSKKHPLLFKLYFDFVAIGMKVARSMCYASFIGSLNQSDKNIAKEKVFKSILFQSLSEAFKEGSIGVARDALIHFTNWGFSLEEITAPTHILHGSDDRLVPVEFSQFNQVHIPVCQLHLFQGEGHLFPARQMREIFSIATKELHLHDLTQSNSYQNS